MSLQLRYLYRAYRYRFRGDPAEIRYMRSRVRRGDTVVDIGGFKGAYTYWMRRFVGASGRVIVFEPQPGQVDYLRDVVRNAKWSNVAIEPYGLSDSAGPLQMFVPRSAHEATFQSQKAYAEPCQTLDVWVTTLDAYFAQRPAMSPDFIKIDVEGHEHAVLAGVRETIHKYKPVILVESEARHRGDGDVRPVFEWFKSHGYTGTFFHRGRRLPISEFDPAAHQRHTPGEKLPVDYVNNFAFEHPSRSSAL